jgi:hypothetical protein
MCMPAYNNAQTKRHGQHHLQPHVLIHAFLMICWEISRKYAVITIRVCPEFTLQALC